MTRISLLIAAAALVGFCFAGSASADPSENAEPIDCTNLVGSPKNLGQLNEFIRESGDFSGVNVPTDAREAGVPVNEWIHTQVFEACVDGPGKFGDPS